MKRLKLYSHQKEGIRRALNQPFFALFMDQGTGKTAVAIRTTVKRYTQEGIHRVVVFAPNHLLYNWDLEIEQWSWLPKDQVRVLRLKGKGKKVWADQLQEFYNYDPELQTLDSLRKLGYMGSKKEIVKRNPAPLMIILLNYEKARILEPQLKGFKVQSLIVDESQRIKGRNTQVSKAIYRLTRNCDSRLLMSGTPVGKGYEDLFMQYKIMDPNIFGTEFRPFEDRFIQKGGYMGKEIVGYKNLSELKSIVAETSYRVKIEDCISLPPLSIKYLSCELSTASQKAYNDLYEDLYTQIPLEATRARLKAILRKNYIPYKAKESYISLLLKAQPFLNISSCELTITQLVKLHQLTGGFLKLDSEELIPMGRDKLDLAIEYLKDRNLPTVVFCNFVSEIRLLEKELSKAFPKKLVVNYRDCVGKEKVEELFKQGKVDIIILQIHSGSVGLNLQKANSVLFYSTNHSADDYWQAVSRIKRPGQKNHMEIVNLICENTIDEDIVENIKRKTQLMNDLWKISGFSPFTNS